MNDADEKYGNKIFQGTVWDGKNQKLLNKNRFVIFRLIELNYNQIFCRINFCVFHRNISENFKSTDFFKKSVKNR
jgi:hypothetical protein